MVLPIFFLTLWKVQEFFPHADPAQWSYWQKHWWPQGMSFFLSGAITGVAAWMLRNRGPHHIFYIPVHWWALTFAVAGIGWFVAEMIYFPTTTLHDVLAKLHH